MAAIAFLAASYVFGANRKHAGISDDQATLIVFIGVVAGLIGARIFYVVQFYGREFSGRPWWDMLKIYEGGLVFFGGFLLALASLVVYCRWRRLSFLAVADAAAPALALAHGIGRIGCFLNGCCWSSKSCALPWGVVYPAESPAGLDTAGIAVHPVQLYETVFNFLLFPLLFFLARKGRKGVAAGAYLIAYGIWRFLVEFWRNEPSYGWFTAAQWIGLGLIPCGVAFLVWALRRPAAADTERRQA